MVDKHRIVVLHHMSVVPPTFDEHLIFCAFHVQVDAAASLRVVDAAQLRYVLKASFVYVHITCCNRERRRHEDRLCMFISHAATERQEDMRIVCVCSYHMLQQRDKKT